MTNPRTPHRRPSAVAAFTARVKRFAEKQQRRLRRIDRRMETLLPAGEVRGKVLFSYIIDPILDRGRNIPHSHTHFWESWTMAKTFVDLGFQVDAISYLNQEFVPVETYDFFIDVRMNMQRLAPQMPSTVKVLHADTGHFTFHNPAQERRRQDLQRRRGVGVSNDKTLPENQAVEHADLVTLLGNAFTQETYAFAGKPMFRIPISVPFEYPVLENKDFDASRRHFLWFGSSGLVHKGLDLVLEAFVGLGEDFHLTICGPIDRERDFVRAYDRELYETPNIQVHGWIDVGSPEFLQLAERTCGLVYPSCSEGGGSSVLTCMHAGIIPLINREVSVDMDAERGVELTDCSVEGIQEAVRGLSARPAEELAMMSQKARDFARARHTKDLFKASYRRFAEELVSGGWRQRPVREHAYEL